MALSYSYIDYSKNPFPMQPPPRKVNGGLYTGIPANGPWGNIPVVPEPNDLAQNLLSANPPKNAEKIPIAFNREGNSFVTFPNYEIYNASHPMTLGRKS
jgi:hypothetical protein